MSRIWIIAFAVFAPVLAAQEGKAPSLADQQLQAQIEKLKAETKAQEATIEKLQAETRKLELEGRSFRLEELLKWLFGAAGLTIPFLLAMSQLSKQSANQLETIQIQARLDREKEQANAEAQAQLKALEIAMGSPTSGGVKNRLLVMKQVMPQSLKNIPEKLDFNDLGFASYRERFLKLIQFIAEHPESRLLAVEAYRALLNEGDNVNARLDTLAARYKKSGKVMGSD
jgi:hypothetical protein